jgi:dolichol-phosphate hexosyltransferase
MPRPDLAILMPVYNERATVAAAVADALEAPLPVKSRELVVVDDGSSDGTREILKNGGWPDNVLVLFHERNRGKGAAVQTALSAANARFAAILDADLEYEAASLGPMLEPLLSGQSQAVFGSRAFLSHTSYNFWYVIGNKAVTLACNLIYNSWISDLMTCHKAMSLELFRSLDLHEHGFAIEPEIAGKLLRRGVLIYEVQVSYKARSRDSGKKLTALDGLRVLKALLRYRVA